MWQLFDNQLSIPLMRRYLYVVSPLATITSHTLWMLFFLHAFFFITLLPSYIVPIFLVLFILKVIDHFLFLLDKKKFSYLIKIMYIMVTVPSIGGFNEYFNSDQILCKPC